MKDRPASEVRSPLAECRSPSQISTTYFQDTGCDLLAMKPRRLRCLMVIDILNEELFTNTRHVKKHRTRCALVKEQIRLDIKK